MEENNKYYRFADKTEQIKRANRFLVMGYAVYYLAMLVIVWISFLRGIRSLGYSVMISIIILIAATVPFVIQKLNAASQKLRYTTLPGLLIVSFLMTFAFDESYVLFLGAFPLIGCILFFDKKYIYFFFWLNLFISLIIQYLQFLL